MNMICGLDPIIDFGTNPRLSLAAAGQMASPLQVAWVFAHLDVRVQTWRGCPTSFQPEARIQALATWLIMRGRLVWPVVDHEVITDPKMLSLIQFWNPVSDLSMEELMHPSRWPDLAPDAINIASVLDLLIRQHQHLPNCQGPEVLKSEDEPMTAVDDANDDDAPTPWVPANAVQPVLPVPTPDECVVIFQHEFNDPVKTSVSEGCTLRHLIHAHAQLVGSFRVIHASDEQGTWLDMSHVLQLGQVVCIQCEDSSSPGAESVTVPHACANVGAPVDDLHGPLGGKDDTHDPIVTLSPTLPWTCHPQASVTDAPDPTFGQYDAGACETPTRPMADCESWISAAPLLCLSGDQYKSLQVPCVTGPKHLWALKHQLLKSTDRATILERQQGVWTDDEFRHHIALLLRMRTEKSFVEPLRPACQCISLDPLLLTGWVHHGTDMCKVWAKSHMDIKDAGTILISACMFAGHWVPVVLTPNGDVLHFSTWDSPGHSHEALNKVIEVLGHLLGFQRVEYIRQQRMFFSSDKCGALAMAFLHHSIFNTMLPTSGDEADVVHARLRAVYCQAVSACELAHRPWVWGSGDNEDDHFANEPGQSSAISVSDSASVLPMTLPSNATGCVSHQCMSKEDRLTLLREKGKMWGDDEIRYHIQHMILHPICVVNRPYATIPGFVSLDPLLLTTWDSIGKPMCEAWCRRNMLVMTHGFHVVSAFLHQEHWFPVWIVPHGRTLVAHTVDDGVIDPQILVPMLEVLRDQFGFSDVTTHCYPQGIANHDLCGAAAVAFLGHIIVGAEMPRTFQDLSYYHSNMKASFVQALFDGTCCICPVAWGSGPNAALAKALANELQKHGVPEHAADQRAQQALAAIGVEQIQQALASRNVWRSLKVMGNNVRFQFLLPAELAEMAANNKGLSIGKRMKQTAPKPRPHFPDAVDPSKLALPEGVFHAKGVPVPQISAKQLGPLAHGIALINAADALPYLRAGKVVSSEPLALAVFSPVGQEVDTCLPHTKVMMPCVCIANNEPILTEAVVVQLGSGFVEKQVISSAISLDQLDVVTVKVLVYRDEVPSSWDEFANAPIKFLVRVFPS